MPRALVRLVRRIARTSPVLLAVLLLVACVPLAPPERSKILPPTLPAPAPLNGATRSLLALPPVPFEPEIAEAGEPVAYRVRAGELAARYGADGVTYALHGHDPAEVDADTVTRCQPLVDPRPAPGCDELSPTRLWLLQQDFVGANLTPPLAVDQSETVVSRFVGAHRDWQSAVPTYSRLVYADLWSGVDLAYEQSGARQLKSTYSVAAGADAGQIRLLWRGAAGRVAEDGTLILATPLGEVRESPPVAWQEVGGERRPVEIQYEIVSRLDAGPLSETEIGFALGVYDRSVPLTIDPFLAYVSYLGGSGQDRGSAVAVDATGSAYVAGIAVSTQATFPTGGGFVGTPGFDQTHNGVSDVYVVKLNPAGTGLVYATYIGGAASDFGNAIAVDAAGSAYVAGSTLSPQATFPDGDPNANDQMDVPGFDQTYNGGQDAFVVKLSPSGTALVYATYIGGDIEDQATDIAIDSTGHAYVSGYTGSSQATFPDGDPNANDQMDVPGHDQTQSGQFDTFVVKLNPAGTGLLYATYVGGANTDTSSGLAVDGSGNAYLTGSTNSMQDTFPDGTGFRGTPGYDQLFNGDYDAFAVKLNAAGTGLLYATYIGGDAFEGAVDVATDASGAAYVTGFTGSTQTTFPFGGGFLGVPGFDQTHNGISDGFVVKLTPAGTSLVYATFFGGEVQDVPTALAVDAQGRVYVAGSTASTQTSFPDGDPNSNDRMDVPGIDQTFNGVPGDYDGFVVALASDGLSVISATYLGGANSDNIRGIAVDTSSNVYLVGEAISNEATFPDGDPNGNDLMDVPGFDQNHNSPGVHLDAIVAKIGEPTVVTAPTTPTSVSTATPTPVATSMPPPTLSPTPTATVGVGQQPSAPATPALGVGLRVASAGPDLLQVTVTARGASGTIRSLRFGTASNALVDLPGGPTGIPGGVTHNLQGGPHQYAFTVRRIAPGQAVMVPLVVIDDQGEWPTFVGGGQASFR